MGVFKESIKSALRRYDYELCRLYEDEKRDVPQYRSFTYREVQCYRAMSWMGQLSVEEARFLGALVRESDAARPIIEIGTLFGFSTMAIILFKAKEQPLITVDNYSWNPLGLSSDAHFKITRDRLAEGIAHYNVTVVRQSKDEFYRTYNGAPPSVFFCDADHTYEATKADLLWARSIGASVICGDDYVPGKHPGVMRAVDEMGGPRQLVDGFFLL